VSAAGGILLLVSMFLPWYAVDAAVDLPNRPGGVTVRGEGVSAWEAFSVIDLVLVAVAMVALSLIVARLAGLRAGAVPPGLIVAVAGAVCAGLILFRLLDPPNLAGAEVEGTEVGRRLGAFFALLAAAAINWAGFRALGAGVAAEPEAEPLVVQAEPVTRPMDREPEPVIAVAPAPRPTPAASPPSPPVRSAGVAAFEDLIAGMEPLLFRLWETPAAPRADHHDVPRSPGVYLFSRDDRPLYIGQSANLRQALAEQCRPSSGHTKATFAFAVARRAAAGEGVDVDGPPARLATSDEFVPYFAKAKQAVAALPVRYLTVDSVDERGVFEVYGRLVLGIDSDADVSA